jgi:hypothetical protein
MSIKKMQDCAIFLLTTNNIGYIVAGMGTKIEWCDESWNPIKRKGYLTGRQTEILEDIFEKAASQVEWSR